MVIKTDLDPNALLTTKEGGVDEKGAGIEILGEIEEDSRSARAETKTLDLQPGSYVLICNLVEKEEGQTEAHYKLGMRAPFTVQ